MSLGRSSSFRLALAAGVSLLSGCGEVLYGEIDIPEVCARMKPYAFQTPALPMEGTFTPTLSLEVELEDALPLDLDLVNADVRFRRATFRALRGNLGLLDALELEAVHASARSEPTVMATWSGPASATTELHLPGNDTVNLFPYIQDGSLRFNLSFTAHMPDEDAEIEPVLCLGMKGRINYGDALTESL
ncbi:hypothetical protein [Myxococcus sp. Y35]|uniref:hypothetical protein n=1 Tax=Pseudomyxococcus flavus TaxID=3115648 RepID=UPI003CF557BD